LGFSDSLFYGLGLVMDLGSLFIGFSLSMRISTLNF